MSKPVLSFCVPTYNRGSIAYECVCSILAYTGGDIEVIVSNNGSTDNTHELMQTICDSRLIYVWNEKNLGPTRNFFITMECATADFFYLISDEDRIEIENIPHFINIIKQNSNLAGVAGGRAGENGKFYNVIYDKVYKKGFNALKKFGFTHSSNMSAFIFNKTLIDFNYSFSSLYTLIEIANNLCVQGDVLASNRILSYTGVMQGQNDYSGGFLDSKVIFFEPRGRINNLYRLNVRQLASYNLTGMQFHYFHTKIIAVILQNIYAFKSTPKDVLDYYGITKNGRELRFSQAIKEMYTIADELLSERKRSNLKISFDHVVWSISAYIYWFVKTAMIPLEIVYCKIVRALQRRYVHD